MAIATVVITATIACRFILAGSLMVCSFFTLLPQDPVADVQDDGELKARGEGVGDEFGCILRYYRGVVSEYVCDSGDYSPYQEEDRGGRSYCEHHYGYSGKITHVLPPLTAFSPTLSPIFQGSF